MALGFETSTMHGFLDQLQVDGYTCMKCHQTNALGTNWPNNERLRRLYSQQAWRVTLRRESQDTLPGHQLHRKKPARLCRLSISREEHKHPGQFSTASLRRSTFT